MNELYQDLAYAIIKQAVTDYKKSMRQLRRNDKYKPAQKTKKECEKFFQSDWFQFLSRIDPNYLLEGIARLKNDGE